MSYNTTPLSHNTVANPFSRGDKITVPKGTLIHSTHPQRKHYAAGRTHTITVFGSGNGWVELDRYYGDRGQVYLPTISWAGAGGYWCDIQLTPELAAANGIEMPELPGKDGKIGYQELDVIPSYDDGYTNRWTA